jgi:hypothetical protein
MPRKRRPTRLSQYEIPANDVDPNAPVPAADEYLVRHALVDFDEVAVLSGQVREQLVSNLVDAIRFARAGVDAGKRGLSNTALAQQVFLSDVGRALERAGLPAKRWRKRYDNGGGESFFFRLAREVAAVSGLVLPQDLKLPGRQSAQHQYGVMSPIMRAAQERELTSRARRPRKRPSKS